MGWGQGRLTYRALDEPCKAYYPHTFGLKSHDFTLRLNLTVDRFVSGVPWAGKGLPFPFFLVWVPLQVFDFGIFDVKLFGFIRLFSYRLRTCFIAGRFHRRRRRRRRRRLRCCLPLSCAKFN